MQTSQAPRPPQAATGEDQTGSVTVTVDHQGLVQDVAISALPDALRESGRLALAFEQAVTRANANASPPAPPPPGEEIVRASRPRRPERLSTRELVESAMRRGHRPVPSARRLIGGEVGTSRNDCVSVELDRTGPTGTPTFDQGWLHQAREKNIAAAIIEAFAAAYETRTSR